MLKRFPQGWVWQPWPLQLVDLVLGPAWPLGHEWVAEWTGGVSEDLVGCGGLALSGKLWSEWIG